MAKPDKEKKLGAMPLTRHKTEVVDLNEVAKNVIEITKDNFQDFADFLASYLKLNLEKFGEPTLIHHLDKVTLALKLRELTPTEPPKK